MLIRKAVRIEIKLSVFSNIEVSVICVCDCDYYYFFNAVAGDEMSVTSKEFADDPCSSMKRGAMVRAARALLSAVTRLLIIADMVDVHLLLKTLRIVRDLVNILNMY